MNNKLVVIYEFANDSQAGVSEYNKMVDLATKADMEVYDFIECFGKMLGADSYMICDASCLED